MEHQKIINLLNKLPNQPFEFRAKNRVQVNRKYNTNTQTCKM